MQNTNLNERNETTNKSSVILKAGIWYTISNFLFRGIGFITTPIFSRLLTKSELGMFTNFTSWLTILALVTSLELQMVVIRSKMKIKDDLDSHIFSMSVISSIFTIIMYVLYLLFPNIFISFLQIEEKYFNIIFLYLLLTPSFQLLVTKYRALYKYKTFTIITGIMTLSSVIFSLILTILLENKLDGRIYGLYIPQIVIGLICYANIIYYGKKINMFYIKEALYMAIPLIPHALSLYLLSSSDKIMITKFSGPEITAVYSIAYSAYHILTIIFDSMNKAWAPWLVDNLHLKRYNDIRKVSKIYILVFSVVSLLVILFIPEIIYILGGEKYMDAVYSMPPLVMSVSLQVIYTIYVNVEFFLKKSVDIAKSTIIATIVNIILNLIFIPLNPEKGYIIASYTTMVGYFILLILHYRTLKKYDMIFMFDQKYIAYTLSIIFVLTMSMNIIFKLTIIRYVVAISLLIVGVIYLYNNRKKLIEIIKSKK